MRRRLDAELVRRGLARSREHASQLIDDGLVSIRGIVMTKPATQVEEADPLNVVERTSSQWVSRGAFKLLGAVEAFPELVVEGARALDAGASTGGFTQVLLAKGVRSVMAVDVGYGQLAWELRNDERVSVHERVNVRSLSPDQLPTTPNLVVADLSFISLRTVLPALVACASPDAHFLLMVKPQFEVGREHVGNGVVTDLGLRAQAVADVAHAAQAYGLRVFGVAASPLPGPKGNVEFFLWLGAAGASANVPELTEPTLAARIGAVVAENAP
jgi:23S rRNA (cytidine1920-2'-O)/16S rRNA (cytidine1409-2'-O)-methyltransferase